MKKYFAAGIVAVMVFAFAAFAATFNLDDSVLAVGVGDVSDCGDVQVKSWGAETNTSTVSFVRLVVPEECYGTDEDRKVLFAAVFDDEGDKLDRSNEHPLENFTDGEEKVDFQDPVAIGSIESLEVTIHTKRVDIP